MEKRRRLAFVLFTVPFLLRSALSLVWGRPNDGFMILIMLGIFVAPVILYFVSLRWCRYVIGVLSLLGGFFCLVMPFSLHGQPTPGFWLLGIALLLIFLFTAIMAFAREPAPHNLNVRRKVVNGRAIIFDGPPPGLPAPKVRPHTILGQFIPASVGTP